MFEFDGGRLQGLSSLRPGGSWYFFDEVLGESGSGKWIMRYRTLGRTNWEVSEIGYGMWGMAGWMGSDDDESMRSLQHAVNLGCNFFDTAWGSFFSW